MNKVGCKARGKEVVFIYTLLLLVLQSIALREIRIYRRLKETNMHVSKVLTDFIYIYIKKTKTLSLFLALSKYLRICGFCGHVLKLHFQVTFLLTNASQLKV